MDGPWFMAFTAVLVGPPCIALFVGTCFPSAVKIPVTSGESLRPRKRNDTWSMMRLFCVVVGYSIINLLVYIFLSLFTVMGAAAWWMAARMDEHWKPSIWIVYATLTALSLRFIRNDWVPILLPVAAAPYIIGKRLDEERPINYWEFFWKETTKIGCVVGGYVIGYSFVAMGPEQASVFPVWVYAGVAIILLVSLVANIYVIFQPIVARFER